MVTRNGNCQEGLSTAESRRAMHSTDNGHPGDSPKLCCGPPTLGFELVSTGKQQRVQPSAGITRVSGLGRPGVNNNNNNNGLRNSHLGSTATASPPPTQLPPGASLLDTGSLGEGVTTRGLPGGTGGGPTASSGPGGISSATSATSGEARECAGCGKLITERFLLKALDLFWHEDCLKCGCCDCRLGEVGSTLYTKANLILCKRDYLRLFGTTGYCAACSKVIPAFEMVMRAKSNVYHLECFACQQCNHRFCVGDRFYLCDNKILCEYDYEERLVFANMAYNPSSLAHIRRQVGNLQPSGDDMIGMGGTGNGGVLPPTSSLCPSLKEGLPVFCSEKQTWSPSRDAAQRAGIPGASGDEEASSGYGSPDSQPECPPPLQPPTEAR